MKEMAKPDHTKMLQKRICLFAGINGLLDGITWTCLSLLCIFCYGEIISFNFDPKTPIEDEPYYKIIYRMFLNKSGDRPTDVIIGSKEFFIFMCFMCILSVPWTILSGYLTWTSIHNKWVNCKYLFLWWAIDTFLISIVQLVLTILLSVDFYKNRYEPQDILISYGIVIAVVLGALIMWLLNVALAGLLTHFLRKEIQAENAPTTTEFINAFGNQNNGVARDLWISPPPDLNTDNFNNDGYTRDEVVLSPDNLEFRNNNRLPSQNRFNEPSASNANQPSRSYQPDYHNPPTPDYAGNNRVQRENARNLPPLNIPQQRPPVEPSAPFIPEPDYDKIEINNNNNKSGKGNNSGPNIPYPDYSPPGTPRSKSILRSKSNYE